MPAQRPPPLPSGLSGRQMHPMSQAGGLGVTPAAGWDVAPWPFTPVGGPVGPRSRMRPGGWYLQSSRARAQRRRRKARVSEQRPRRPGCPCPAPKSSGGPGWQSAWGRGPSPQPWGGSGKCLPQLSTSPWFQTRCPPFLVASVVFLSPHLSTGPALTLTTILTLRITFTFTPPIALPQGLP